MRKYIYRFLILISILSFGISIKSQDLFKQKTYLSPEVSIGYTFGAKVNVGFGLDFGFIDNHNENLRYGLSLNYNLIRVRDRFHRQILLNVMLQNEFIDLKFGAGRLRNGWGYENRNKCIVYGLAGDISFNYPSIYSPKIGYRGFLYNKRQWAWFEHQYNSIYIGYEYFSNFTP